MAEGRAIAYQMAVAGAFCTGDRHQDRARDGLLLGDLPYLVAFVFYMVFGAAEIARDDGVGWLIVRDHLSALVLGVAPASAFLASSPRRAETGLVLVPCAAMHALRR